MVGNDRESLRSGRSGVNLIGFFVIKKNKYPILVDWNTCFVGSIKNLNSGFSELSFEHR